MERKPKLEMEGRNNRLSYYWSGLKPKISNESHIPSLKAGVNKAKRQSGEFRMEKKCLTLDA